MSGYVRLNPGLEATARATATALMDDLGCLAWWQPGSVTAGHISRIN
ncbi:hypothetical protein H310_13490 [Aphanomyces invadans]|uniref:Uncharacterized protein n=1 Tax=Aphanomyces invadans TaxID=157072 RepID=A0A024TFY3_9STRA|nr:hypothetical protein H310_13490 [Aphanomyces invadans]ETV92267.1 hypothetical protein H310_13490 [Aphanomyces invadans]|eukprot:XP_008879231.1 hypothetical protein H310_13490 [Aphanomyces invadans]